jgi:hypothetical protein
VSVTLTAPATPAPTALSDKQLESVATSTARVNLWTGSVRSGKTIGSLLRWLMFVADPPRGGELCVFGRTRESIARNVFGPLSDPTLFGPAARHVSYTPGAPTARMLGRTIHVLGASDTRAEAVVRGMTMAGAYGDELTLVSEAFYKQVLARLSVPGSALFATTNPDGPAHWVKKQVIDRAAELAYRVFQFRLSDNTHLDPGYVAQIMREYTGLWFRRFVLGEWVMADGAVYENWDVERHVIRAADLPRMERVVSLGVDYGTTNATRGMLLGIGRGPNGRHRLHVVDEWAPERGTDAQLSASLRRWLPGRPEALWQSPEWVAVDPAAASFKLQLFQDGVSNVMNAQNDVLAGIRTVASLLSTEQLVVADSCRKLIEYLPGYSWDSKATAKGQDAVIKVDDHEVDALRYAVHSTRALWRGIVPVAAAADTAPAAA